VQLSSATTNQHLDIQCWVLPGNGILAYNAPQQMTN